MNVETLKSERVNISRFDGKLFIRHPAHPQLVAHDPVTKRNSWELELAPLDSEKVRNSGM